jgi:hypothetical protein
MPKTIHLPIVGNIPKGAAIAGVGSAVVVTGYLIYKHSKDAATAMTGATGATGYGYGTTGLPYNSFYGYGSNYAPSGVTPYPVGSEYGYGAYGYGDYNPYTGQYLGGSGSVTAPPLAPAPTSGKSGWVTINGIKEYVNEKKGTIGRYEGSGKKRHWVTSKI